MARPRTIDPENGRTRTFTVRVAEAQLVELSKEAEERKISVGALVRERIEQAAP
jgi:hypothetical protein